MESIGSTRGTILMFPWMTIMPPSLQSIPISTFSNGKWERMEQSTFRAMSSYRLPKVFVSLRPVTPRFTGKSEGAIRRKRLPIAPRRTRVKKVHGPSESLSTSTTPVSARTLLRTCVQVSECENCTIHTPMTCGSTPVITRTCALCSHLLREIPPQRWYSSLESQALARRATSEARRSSMTSMSSHATETSG
ncbi:putative replication protein [uncultured virus]|uniref:Putative replication protein n=1 Tax=uncultured virus TaxID=340016 RepID=A0A1I9XGE7_9VIRU|nr:putative replication protein [uncultured virus]